MRLLVFLSFSVLSVFLFSLVEARLHHHGHHGRRRLRSMPHFPYRNEKTAAQCGPREHHVTCGPERHCDKSCDNLYSPPHCFHDTSNPKCFYPRCLCNEGYVRDANGRCIRPSRCPNTYVEQSDTDKGDVEFKLIKHSRPRRKHHRKPEDNFFW